MQLRRAHDEDVPSICSIYNLEVQTGTATFDTEPVSVEARRRWLAQHDRPAHPVFVVDEAGEVIGFGSLSSWSERRGYDRSAEVSVYVHHAHRGRGVGRLLLQALIEAGAEAGLLGLMARITSDSDASRRLHRSLGFVHSGTLHRIGEKFGRVLDVELHQYHYPR
ncbi:MAG: GNAT family N-acetyltransferase [Myxococcota bacterium]